MIIICCCRLKTSHGISEMSSFHKEKHSCSKVDHRRMCEDLKVFNKWCFHSIDRSRNTIKETSNFANSRTFFFSLLLTYYPLKGHNKVMLCCQTLLKTMELTLIQIVVSTDTKYVRLIF